MAAEKQTRLWSIEHKEQRIGPMSSYALALWGLQGLLYPNDVITVEGKQKVFAGYLEGMQPFIRNNGHLRRARLWAIAGGKGGVGKSVIAAMISLTLARMQKRVVIIDADFSGANLRELFSLRYPSPNIWKLIEEKRSLSSAAVPSSFPNIRIITAPEKSHDAEAFDIIRRIDFIRALRSLDADYVIMDFGPRTDYRELDYFLTADLNIIVSTPEPTSLENLSKFVKTIVKRKIDVAMRSLTHNGDGEIPFEDFQTPLVHQALEQMRTLNLPAEEILRRIAGSFNMHVIFNQVRDRNYLKDFTLLHKYLSHEVGLALSMAGGIRFEPIVRQAVQNNDLRILIRYTNSAFRDVFEITKNLISAKNRYSDSLMLNVSDTSAKNSDQAVCGIWCNAWGECNYQNPGRTCLLRVLN